MTDLFPYLIALGGTGGLGSLATWWRLSRQERHQHQLGLGEQVSEATKTLFEQQNEVITRQGNQIIHLEGRLDQITKQMTEIMGENQRLVIDLDAARGRIDILEGLNKELSQENATLRRLVQGVPTA